MSERITTAVFLVLGPMLIGFRAVSCDSAGQRAKPVPSVESSSLRPATEPDARVGLDALRVPTPFSIEISKDTRATELPELVRRALPGISRPCWIVWGDFRQTADTRALALHGADTGALAAPAWITCPAPSRADFISRYGDERVKLVGKAYFRGDHFEYKAPEPPESRGSTALAVDPEAGLARDMLARMRGVTERCLFAYLRVR